MGIPFLYQSDYDNNMTDFINSDHVTTLNVTESNLLLTDYDVNLYLITQQRCANLKWCIDVSTKIRVRIIFFF